MAPQYRLNTFNVETTSGFTEMGIAANSWQICILSQSGLFFAIKKAP